MRREVPTSTRGLKLLATRLLPVVRSEHDDIAWAMFVADALRGWYLPRVKKHVPGIKPEAVDCMVLRHMLLGALSQVQ